MIIPKEMYGKRINKAHTANTLYKKLGFKWLIQAFCPASTFVLADRYEARNPQRFIHATVGGNLKKQLTTKNIQENEAISNCKIE